MSEPGVFKKEWKGMTLQTRASWILGVSAVLALLLFYCLSVFSHNPKSVNLVIYAYSTQEEVLSQGIFPRFEKLWESTYGRDLTIEGIFGPSLTLAGQIVLGAPADVAILSDKQHVTYLKLGKMVQENNQPLVVCKTPMVIVTRPGNPKGIRNFMDLANPDLQLIHADPRSSGAGAWAIFAEYGCSKVEPTNEVDAEELLISIWKNVKIMAPSARASLMLFESGVGDALVTYEQDARLALARHVDLSIVIPPCTVMAEPAAVIVDKNVTRDERSAANEFLQYLLSEEGQNAFIQYQLRPVTVSTDVFLKVVQAVTEDDLGGWSEAHQELIEGVWKNKIEPNLHLELGIDSIQVYGE